MNYEIHLTYHREDGAKVDNAIRQLRNLSLIWKYSEIYGDPLLGKSPFAYLTAHSNNLNELRETVEDDAAAIENFCKVKYVRAKIEAILWDTKTNHEQGDESMLGLLAQCRDAWPAPKPWPHHTAQYQGLFDLAVAFPASVPEYVRARASETLWKRFRHWSGL